MPQSSLFSFFNKKPSTTSAAASTPASSNAQTKKPALSASNDSLKSDVSKEPIKPIPMSKEIAPVSSLSDSHQKEVIFHKSEDDKMCVDGDDDVSTKRPRPSSMNDGDSSPDIVVKRSKNNSKSKLVSSEKLGDDEEAEWDGEDSSENDNDDDSDASDNASGSDDDDDGDDNFLVDSDDDNAFNSNNKKVSKNKKKIIKPLSKSSAKISKNTTTTPLIKSSSKAVSSGGSGIQMTLSGTPIGSQPSQDALYLCDRMLSNPSGLSQKAEVNIAKALPDGVTGLGNHDHDKLEWLKLNNRKDKKGRKVDHPDYDPRTLLVPVEFMQKESPGMKQWWQLKSDNFDTILFFKVGKFYELYHTDADVGMSELELVFMKGTRAHSGFPEVSYGKYAEMLVKLGYRVARVEQVETPDQLKERNASAKLLDKKAKADKVVRRELCSVLTKGTRTFCHLDDVKDLIERESKGLNDTDTSSVLLCIKESIIKDKSVSSDDGVAAITEYGVCIVDSVLGNVTLAQFQDDGQRSRLRTLVARYVPTEVLLEHNKTDEELSHASETVGCIQLMAPKAVIDLLRGDEMPSADSSLKILQQGKYFVPEPGSATTSSSSNSSDNDEDYWPSVLSAVKAGLTDGSSALVMTALGGCLWRMKRSLIDYEVMSHGKVYGYVPPDETPTQKVLGVTAATSTTDEEDEEGPEHMVLDAVSLTNLEILVTSFDRSEKGSLYSFVNRCKTAFGRRLLKEWLCKPLYRPSAINRRAAGVRELTTTEVRECARKSQLALNGTPDLERLLQRVQTLGSKRRTIEHPDGRAVMFEESTYNKRKIKDFATVLGGFENLLKAGDELLKVSLNSQSLKSLIQRFPLNQMRELLKHFREVFDEKQAHKDGKVKPRPGIDESYDRAKEDIEIINNELQDHLRQMKKETGIANLCFFGTNKDRFQIEVPIGSIGRVPSDWNLKTQKKTHRRYWTNTIVELLQRLVDAESRLDEAQRDTMRRLFAKFDDSRQVWSSAVACSAHLDALFSLASVSDCPGYIWPEIRARNGISPPELDIVAGRHPMLEFSMQSKGEGDYIPNGLHLGGYNNDDNSEFNPRLLLLSGPNMGGKSTLLRQTCLITILAQMGCAVPADKCIMTPVDRIFTRVGASDRILAGQSTFFVELAETATILHSATDNSLCILDELGRGTATHDGTAIAHAVVDRLARKTRCRTLFATHYHSLVDDWGVDPRIQLGHMSCMVGDSIAATDQEVTFLYRLANGSSPKSYGVNVARLAHLPADVIALAAKQSKDFEARMNGNNNNESDGAAALIGKNRDAAATFFDSLLSITNSEMSTDELKYVISELFKRYNQIQKL